MTVCDPNARTGHEIILILMSFRVVMLPIQLLEKDLFIVFKQELETSRPLDFFGEK